MPRTTETAWLELRFGAGERPHLFWVSDWTAEVCARRFKVLSKSLPSGSIEVAVIEEVDGSPPKERARERVDGRPAGWLERWVGELARDLGVEFFRFDLRSVASEAEWFEVADRLGWRSTGSK